MIQLLRLVGNHCEVVSTARLPIQPNNGRSISTSTKGADRWNELGNRRSLIARIPPPSSAFYSTNIRAFCRHVISFMNRGHQEAKKVYVQSCLGLTHPGKVTQRSSRARRSSNSNFWKAKLHFRAHTLGSPDDLQQAHCIERSPDLDSVSIRWGWRGLLCHRNDVAMWNPCLQTDPCPVLEDYLFPRGWLKVATPKLNSEATSLTCFWTHK
jgi:hypothetical protein